MSDKSIQQGLEQDARLIEERMPEKMTKKVILDVKLRLREFIGKTGFSQTKIGRMVGFKTGSVISSFLKGDYKGDVKGLVEKLHQLMESYIRRDRRPKAQPFIKTSVAKKIFTVIAETEAFSNDQEGKIGVIIGDSGHGKSHCLRQYAEGNKNTIYVELDDVMTSTSIFAEIAKRLGIDSGGSRDRIARRLIETLQNRHIIILLDEASRISVSNLNLLRQIIVIKSRCPLILAGNRDLLKTITLPPTRPGCESLDQFKSRLMWILDVDELANDKKGGLYPAEDIRQLYQYGGISLTGDAVKALCGIAKIPKSGRLRTCGHIIAACHYSASIQKRGFIDSSSLIGAIEELHLAVKERLPFHTRDITEEPEKELTAAAAKAG